MKRLLILLLTTLLAWSCNSEPVDGPGPSPWPVPPHPGAFVVYVQDANGADMLNPRTPNYLKPDYTRYLFINDKGKVEMVSNTPNWFGYSVSYGAEISIRFVFKGLKYSNTKPDFFYCTNYIRWADKTEDTIEAKFRIDSGNAQEMYFNGQLLWQGDWTTFQKEPLFIKVIDGNKPPRFKVIPR